LKKTLLTLVMGTTLVMGLAACGGGSSTNNKGTDTASAGNAKDIFAKNCASCHGDQLQGVVGPSLQKIGSKYSKAEILDIIKNGKGGGKMPGGLISGDDADKVATWLAAKK
jgi:cytochrome c551